MRITPGQRAWGRNSAAVVACACLVGCRGMTPGSGRTLEASAFSGAEPVPVSPLARAPSSGRALGVDEPIRVAGLATVTESGEVLVAVPGAPPPPMVPDDQPTFTSAGIVHDAKVGEINGRPIFASDYLNEFRGELEADRRARESGEQPGGREAWLAAARRRVREKLTRELHDQLLVGEALAEIKPERRAGFRAFLEEYSEEQRRRAGGSRVRLEQELLERGQTIESSIRSNERYLLAQQLTMRRIDSRVRVSWNDIQRAWARSPESSARQVAVLRLIRVWRTDADALKRVTDALEQGVPFAEVALDPANTSREPLERPFEGDYQTASLLSAELNAAAQLLQPGEHTAQPIRSNDGRMLTWIGLERIDRQAPRLEDMPDRQFQIATQLLRDARANELLKYLLELRQRARVSDIQINEMADRLVEIAASWWWPEDS